MFIHPVIAREIMKQKEEEIQRKTRYSWQRREAQLICKEARRVRRAEKKNMWGNWKPS